MLHLCGTLVDFVPLATPQHNISEDLYLLLSNENQMLAVNISAKHAYIHIFRLIDIPQNVYHVHITCFILTLWGWKGW